MGQTLRGLVGVDTNCCIYFLEESALYFPVVSDLFVRASQGQLKLVTSIITPIEVLSSAKTPPELLTVFGSFFSKFSELQIRGVEYAIVEEVARLRRTYHLTTPDAIQLATAISAGADLFVTNDINLKRAEKEIKIVLLSELVGK